MNYYWDHMVNVHDITVTYVTYVLSACFIPLRDDVFVNMNHLSHVNKLLLGLELTVH